MIKGRNGVVVLVNGDVHAAFIVTDISGKNLDRIREGIKECKEVDGFKDIRVQGCVIEEATPMKEDAYAFVIRRVKDSIL